MAITRAIRRLIRLAVLGAAGAAASPSVAYA